MKLDRNLYSFTLKQMKFLHYIIYFMGFICIVLFIQSFRSNCSDFELSSVITRKDTAQAAFDKDPIKWKNLDKNHNGIVCE